MRRIVLAILNMIALLLIAGACGGGSAQQQTSTGPASPAATAVGQRSPSAGDTLTTPELVQKVRPSVVQVLTEAAGLQGEIGRGAGTGFIIDREGHVLTNNHVVVRQCDDPVSRISVTLGDGRTSEARIVGRDVATDLAVLQLQTTDNLTPLQMADSNDVLVGEEVVAIGNALGLQGGPTVTKGVVSAKNRVIEESQCGITIPDAIQTDAAINPGNSGGPLVNMRGEAIGVTTAIIAGTGSGIQAQGIGLAVSSNTARPIVEELIKDGRVDRGRLGIVVVDVTPALAQALSLPVDRGVGIREVQQGSPAASAGLRSGDIIVKLADNEIRNAGDLLRALQEHRAGERVRVEYFRSGNRNSAEVTLG